MKKRVLIALSIALNASLLFGQDTGRDVELITDSTFIETDQDFQLFQEVSNLDPQRSALLSAVLPGMGQIYNKQYWKVPVIYVGLASFAHFISYNNDLYHAFRNAAISNSNGLGNPFAEVSSSQTTVIRNRDSFRRNRDFLIILGSVFYLLNIVDAHVSAHLEEFNVNDDLALTIEPSMQSTAMNSTAIGASLILRIK